MPLSFSLSGVNEYIITFEDFCRMCSIRGCAFNKEKPFHIKVECKELTYAREALLYDSIRKAQAKQDPGDTSEVGGKVSSTQVNTKLWNEKEKKNPARIKCISKDFDPLITAQRAQDWWKEFRSVMTKIDKECKKWG